MEEWKDIKDYEGIYQVSNLGRVRSLDRLDSAGHKRSGAILSISTNSCGYSVTSLSKEGRRKQFRVHRLVAQSFLTEEKSKNEVNHKDGDKSNNKVENLEWCDRLENMRHAYEKGLVGNNSRPGGLKTGELTSVALIATHKQTGEVLTFKNSCKAAEFLGLRSGGNIRSAATGKIPSAYGYYWKQA